MLFIKSMQGSTSVYLWDLSEVCLGMSGLGMFRSCIPFRMLLMLDLQSCSASSPCSGEFECVSGICKPCTWGCHGMCIFPLRFGLSDLLT